MGKAVSVQVKLSRVAVDTEFLRKTLETVHSCVVKEAIQEYCCSEQERMDLCSALREKLLYHREEVKNRTA